MTTFLLLATGWRISEFHSCVRDKEVASSPMKKAYRLDHILLLLQKIKISRIDGLINRLCPVKSLQDYLSKSTRFTKGELFLLPSTQKLSKSNVIREYSASYSVIETMDIIEVVSSIGWKTPYIHFGNSTWLKQNHLVYRLFYLVLILLNL